MGILFLKREEAEDIRGMLRDNALSFTTGSQIVSALMLGLQEAFDKERFFYCSTQPAIRRRDQSQGIDFNLDHFIYI